MSRSTLKSNTNKASNPIKFWLSWKGDVGQFQYWDGEKNVLVDNVELFVLDRKSTVTGWNETNQSRIFANAVRNLNEELVVRTKNKQIAKGLWKDIKETVNQAGGNFTVNLYALTRLDNSEDLEPVCVQLDKSCLKSWTDFTEKYKLWQIYEGKLTITRGEEQKKGRVKFFVTEFALDEADPDIAKQASLFDETQLQPYFNGEERAPF